MCSHWGGSAGLGAQTWLLKPRGWNSSGKLNLEASPVPPAVLGTSLVFRQHGGRHQRLPPGVPRAMAARDLRELGMCVLGYKVN